MIVRTQTEIAKLDEELNLFEENEWNFLEVLETHETNFEYFDDSLDLDFTIGHRISNELKIVLGAVCFLAFIIVGCFAMLIWYSNNSLDTNNYVSNENQTTEYINGVEADSTALINASNTLSRYFQILKSQSNLVRLDECCVGKSNFASTYFNYIDQMKENYDSADCYSRAMKLFTESVEYESVDKVVIKDNIYYVYVKMNSPSSTSIEEYWYSIQFNISKHFSSGSVTETDLEKYLIEVVNPNDIPVSDEIWCFEMKEMSDGTFKIISDAQLTELCENS